MLLAHRVGSVLVALLLALQGRASSAEKQPYAAAIGTFSAFARQKMQADRIPGMSVGFVHGDFQWADGFGFADIENEVPAKAVSSYRLASVTKPMTAMAVLALTEAGAIDVDAPVQRYVPSFPEKPYPVTVRLLLGHLGGISHYNDYDLEGHFKDHKDTRAALAVFADFDLVAEPGTRYHYSSYGYNLLGAVIEGATGENYAQVMRRVLWGPLGMQATCMDDPDAIIPHRVRGYRRDPMGATIHSEFVDMSSRFAAGGTRSTVVDLLKLARGVLARQVLRAATYELMWTSMVARDGHLTDYGMGWRIQPVNGRFAVFHTGSQAETRTLLFLLPARGFALAIGCNYEEADLWPYARELVRLVLQEDMSLPVYAGDRIDRAMVHALEDVYNDGLAYVDRFGTALASAPESLATAFAYFNANLRRAALEEDFAATAARLRAGRHPVAQRAFTVVGASMAQQLRDAHGAAVLDSIRRRGVFELFARYDALCRSRKDVPQELRLTPECSERVLAWSRDWNRTWNEATRRLAFDAATDLRETHARLAALFAGAGVVPDFIASLSALAGARFLAGDVPGAVEAGKVAMSLYPFSDRAYAETAIAHLALGDTDAARELLRLAYDLDPQGRASAAALNSDAYRLKSVGRLALGLSLLELALELHPRSANLHDSSGEFYLEAGERERAIDQYEQALALDPGFARAQRALERIRNQRE